jgi:hypothetical protein
LIKITQQQFYDTKASCFGIGSFMDFHKLL